MKKISIIGKSVMVAVLIAGSSFSQSWYAGNGYIYNNGGNVRVSGNRYTQSGDTSSLSFGDAYARLTAKWSLGLYMSVYGYNDLMTLRESGNVGIGTTSPTTKLEVNGDVKAANVQAISKIKLGSVEIFSGSTAPTPALTAPMGSLYIHADTYISRLYIKTYSDWLLVAAGN
jgi:hypothetical protein